MDIRSSKIINSDTGKLKGSAVVYGSQSQDLGGFVEVIEQGAFSQHLITQPDIRALYEHDGKELLGRTTSGTLLVNEDSQGVHVEIQPPSTRAGEDCKELVKRGDITGMSFGFVALEDRWDHNTTPSTRYVTRAELCEVTITALPAYKASSVTLRSLAASKQSDNNALWLNYLEA
ncbi:HK97 family phage prohead protease [Psychromonas sp. KJ10-2]|uniref:HK97 family phage prohead protease n=1 Tax=Psychromonas sp. KJ10-2 TaxID=3391822 RepID=UPI0039B4A84E